MDKIYIIVLGLVLYNSNGASGFTFDADWNTCENGTIEVVLIKNLGQTVIVNYAILEAPAGPPNTLNIGIGGGPTSNGLSAFRSGKDPTKDYIIYYKQWDVPNAITKFITVNKCTKWVQVFTATWPCGDNRKTIYVNFVLEKAYDTDTKIHVSLKDGNTVVIGPLVITIPAGQTSKQITFTAPADKIYTVWYGLVKDGSKKREVQYIQTDQQDVSPPEFAMDSHVSTSHTFCNLESRKYITSTQASFGTRQGTTTPPSTTIPPPTPKPTGITEQDPHMTTFDGVRYNFQGLCTYVLTQDCSNINKPSFQVTAEFRGKYSELRSKPLTRINAVDVNVDGMQLLRILKNDNFLIKGQLFTNSTAVIGNGLGTVKVEDEHVYVQLNNPALSLVWTKPTHGINIALNGPNMRGNVCGLLGNANGDPEDDFMKSDGVIVTKDDIYEFGDSWMVPGSCE